MVFYINENEFWHFVIFLVASINCRNCDAQATCVYDVNRLFYRCQCNEGYTGDGQTCSPLGKLASTFLFT